MSEGCMAKRQQQPKKEMMGTCKLKRRKTVGKKERVKNRIEKVAEM